jgi:hypothetical protein
LMGRSPTMLLAITQTVRSLPRKRQTKSYSGPEMWTHDRAVSIVNRSEVAT